MGKPYPPPDWMIEYQEALRRWKLSGTEWLGLDPARVLDLEIEQDHTGYRSVRWESVTDDKPSRGVFDRFDIRSEPDAPRGVIFTGFAHLDYDDGEALHEHVGPMPRLMSEAEEARLRAALGGR